MIPLYGPQIFVVDFWVNGLADNKKQEEYLRGTLNDKKLLGREFLYSVADGDNLIGVLTHIGVPKRGNSKRIYAVDTEGFRWYEPGGRGIRDMIGRHEVATLAILDRFSFTKRGNGYELDNFDDPESAIKGLARFQF